MYNVLSQPNNPLILLAYDQGVGVQPTTDASQCREWVCFLKLGEESLNAGRFGRFCQQRQAYKVELCCDHHIRDSTVNHIHYIGTFLTEVIDWIGANVSSRWSVAVRGRFHEFTFEDEAEAVLFRMEFAGQYVAPVGLSFSFRRAPQPARPTP